MISTNQWICKNERTNKKFLNEMLEIKNMYISDIDCYYNYNPLLLKDMEKALDIIKDAYHTNKKILISGDYDVDGIMSTYCLSDYLNFLGIINEYYIPHRILEGYGCSKNMVKYAIENNFNIVVTVDNGISSFEPIQMLKDNNITVIVTDHHNCKDELPNADAIINPKQPNDNYPFKGLAGVGVVFKFIQAINGMMDLEDILWEKYYQYVAIGTIADVMSLKDENRYIVQQGLLQLHETNNLGLKELAKMSNKDITTVSATDIAFYFAPKINAASRLDNAYLALDLLKTENQVDCLKLSKTLNNLNLQRKALCDAYFLSAEKQLLYSDYNFNSTNPIIVSSPNWHRGLIGIVASKLTEKYFRPSFVFSEENGILHGSCRSYGHINILDIILQGEKYLESYGGHDEAAGLSIKKENLQEFVNIINEYCSKKINPENLYSYKFADINLNESDITLENALQLKDFEPFGKDNEKPLFIIQNVRIESMKAIGKNENLGKHLKMQLSCNGKKIDAIGFFLAEYIEIIGIYQNIDVLAELDINEWNNNKKVQLIIKDIHFKYNFSYEYLYELTMDEEIMYREKMIEIQDILEEYGTNEKLIVPDKNDYQLIYSKIKILLKKNNNYVYTNIDILCAYLINLCDSCYITPFKVFRVLETLNEAHALVVKFHLYDMISISYDTKMLNKKIDKMSETPAFIRCHNYVSIDKSDEEI